MKLLWGSKTKRTLFAIAASVVIFSAFEFIFGSVIIIELFFAIIFVYLVVSLVRIYLAPSFDLKEWAESRGFAFFQQGKRDEIMNRFNVNPGKTFLKARNIFKLKNYVPIVPSLSNILSTTIEVDPNIVSGPYCEGEIKGRHIWVYPLFGKTKVTSTTSESFFSGWCMEIETIPIPIHALISRRHIDNFDKLDTESRKFENLYQINSEANAKTLQLLDPHMIDIITHSNISAIEFGDQSIALIHTIAPARKASLDCYLDGGIKIADQLDRNYPLANRKTNF